MTPNISVVIPLYNKEAHIARGLNSVLSQTVQDFEILVIDDGSTDGGADVVSGMKNPKIHLISQENKGVSAARNRGINEAKAELIAFLDADDEWLPDFLETILRLKMKYPEAGAYATGYYNKKINKYEMDFCNDSLIEDEGLIRSYFKSAVLFNEILCSSTIAIPKRTFEEVGGFSENEWWGEDTDMWGRIALRYPIAYSCEYKGVYHVNALNRASNKVKPITQNIFVKSALKELESKTISLELQEDLLEYIAMKEIQTARQNLKAGRSDLARFNLSSIATKKLKRQYYWTLFWAYIPSRIYLFLRNTKLIFNRK